jgi:hypothetical protein
MSTRPFHRASSAPHFAEHNGRSKLPSRYIPLGSYQPVFPVCGTRQYVCRICSGELATILHERVGKDGLFIMHHVAC